MRNIFEFAKKELSQDAMLSFIFANYNCKNESIKNTCKILFDAFTNSTLDFSKITDLEVVNQWNKIDISVWFKIDNEEHLIVIEDKVGSLEHNQLKYYNDEIDNHNSYWKKRKNNPNNIRYVTNCQNIFKVFYKTNIIDYDEEKRVKGQGWKVFNIFDIYKLFEDITPTSDLLGFYLEHVKYIYLSAKREFPLDEWNLISWHSFFNDYALIDNISQKKIVDTFQKRFYYIKLFVKGNEKSLPCFEIRSRDFVFQKNKITMKVKAVLSDLKPKASREQIYKWKKMFKDAGFIVNNKDVKKQVAYININFSGNTEEDLKYALDDASRMLCDIFK